MIVLNTSTLHVIVISAANAHWIVIGRDLLIDLYVLQIDAMNAKQTQIALQIALFVKLYMGFARLVLAIVDASFLCGICPKVKLPQENVFDAWFRQPLY